jgi:uncharacterized membrane protein (DUF485 family)
MGGFGHGSAEREPDRPRTAERNARVGLLLFAPYTLVYAAFVVACAVAPAWLEGPAPGGMNRAVTAGLALIGGAVLTALLYAWVCRAPVSEER